MFVADFAAMAVYVIATVAAVVESIAVDVVGLVDPWSAECCSSF